MIPFDRAALEPLTTDALIQRRVTDLVGRAVRRQLWLLFLDADDVQLPTIVPLDDLPVVPPSDPVWDYGELADAAGASSIVAVLERYGDERLTATDAAWARHLRSSCAAASVPLRAVLLSHRRGVRWVSVEDYAA